MGNEIENGRKTAPPKRHENVHQITKPKLDVFSATCITNNVEQIEKNCFSSIILKNSPGYL